MAKNTVFNTRQTMIKSDFEAFHYLDSYVKEVSLHHHDFYEVYCFLNGSANYTIDGRFYRLLPGDILLISPSDLHMLSIPDNKAYERLVLWISPTYLKQISSKKTDLTTPFKKASALNNHMLRLQTAAKEKIISLMTEICNLSSSDSFGNDILSKSKICELLVLLSNEDEFEPSDILDPIEKSIISYINSNLTDPQLSIKQIADAHFISESRLSHVFKEFTGSSVYKYIIKKRLVLSKEYIISGDPITSIYSKCGFNDYVGFFRTFKNEYGITPKEYYRESKK